MEGLSSSIVFNSHFSLAFERLVYGDTRHIYDNESEEIIQRNEREAEYHFYFFKKKKQ